MIDKIRAILGKKTYIVEIKWDTGEKERLTVRAWRPIQAITKVAKIKDVVNKAKLSILNHH